MYAFVLFFFHCSCLLLMPTLTMFCDLTTNLPQYTHTSMQRHAAKPSRQTEFVQIGDNKTNFNQPPYLCSSSFCKPIDESLSSSICSCLLKNGLDLFCQRFFLSQIIFPRSIFYVNLAFAACVCSSEAVDNLFFFFCDGSK
jgi:hypothetical protein